MANKRNEPKPGSQHCWTIGWNDTHAGTFRDMVHKLKREKAGKDILGSAVNQLPMNQRKAVALEYIQRWDVKGSMTRASRIEPAVLKQLIKDGDVYIENGKSGHIRQSHSYVRPTLPAPEVVEEEAPGPYAKRNAALEESGLHYRGKNRGKPRVDNQKVKWTKEKDRKLLVAVLTGTAPQELIDEVGRVKTKMRKIAK